MHIPGLTIDHKTFRLAVPALTLEPGELLGFFGKSGAGKTSYLKRVRELLNPHEVHYLSQFDGLLEEITIRQNIELGLAASGRTSSEARNWEKNHASLLRDFEVDRQLAKYPRSLSGGQRKRAEILRCLIMHPRVLLLDEPFVGIGHLFETICTREILKRAKDASTATIIVSHDYDLLTTFCSRILLVDDHGIIGIVPTRDPAWHPSNVRTAWTLGVENVLSTQALHRLGATDVFASDKQSIGFWARSAAWDEKTMRTIRLPRSAIRSTSSTVKQGMTVTRAEVIIAENTAPITLVGRGSIADSRDPVLLGIDDAWVLSA